MVRHIIHRWGLLSLIVAAGMGTGCDNTAQRARMVIRFDAPVRYKVVSGDTLAAIAEKYAIEVNDIVAWNELQSTELHPGELLFLWKLPKPVADASHDTQLTAVRPGSRGHPAERAQPRPRAAPGAVPQPAAAPRSQRPDRPTSVRNAGLFGAGTDTESGLNDGLADAVAGLTHERSSIGSAGIRDASDMRATEAERSATMGRVVQAPPRTGPYVPNTPVQTPSVRRARAKRCLSQSQRHNTGDDGMYGGKGLSSGQIKAGLSRNLNLTRRCMPSGTSGSFSVVMEINVGCDGRVKNVYPVNRGGLPPTVLSCIETVLSASGFPAHDLPDGQSFQYPIHYRF